jgi:alcohol dehydrogenase class IV
MMWKLTKIWYRIFQFFFYKACYLLIWRKPEIIRGPGSLSNLPAAIQARGVHKLLVVTDPGLMSTGIPGRLCSALDAAKIEYVLFDKVEANPSIDTIEKVRAMYLENKCQGFAAIGGGSSMDTAKAAGTRIARPRKSLEKMGGFLKVGRKLPPLFMIPTTAGTGSETTIVAVVTDRKTQHKFAISDLHLIPHVAVLDPELTVGLPPAITAATGMDAMTHAVESYICQGVPGTCKRYSEEAVGHIVKNMEIVYKNGKDLKARENMLTASFLAGAAFTRAGLNYIHPIAHTMSGLYDEPHGRANAVIIPHVLEYYGACVHKKLARLANAAGLDIKGKSDAECAAAFIAEIRRLNRAMNIPDGFDFIKTEDIPRICEWALHEANPFYPVPKILGQEDMIVLVKQIMLKK